MKKLLIFISLIVVSCNNEHSNDSQTISVPLDNDNIFTQVEDIVSDINILPLFYPDEVILSSDNLIKADDNVIIFVDRLHSKKIHIFNKDGRYRATIAAEGRGPGEYIDMASTQIVDNMIMVYSYHKKSVLFYDYDGKFVSQCELSHIPYNILKVDNGYWGYMGYGNGQMEERVVKMDTEGEIAQKLLPSDAKIFPMTEVEDIFVPSKFGILLRETFSNSIYVIKDAEAELFLNFDFGKYSIPDNYYGYSSPMKAAESLLQTDFVTINQVYVNNNIIAMYIVCNVNSNPDKAFDALIYNCGTRWQSVKVANGDSLLYKSLKGITPNDELLLLVDEERVKEIADKYPSLLSTDKIEYTKDDKQHIVLCKLKYL